MKAVASKPQAAARARDKAPEVQAKPWQLGAQPAAVSMAKPGCPCGGGCPRCRAAKAAPADRAPPIVHDVLSAPGAPLSGAARADMQERFGQDLGDVRVHADARAARSASAVKAAAYTVGPHVVFGAGRYAPHTARGRFTLAHELTHVLQQRGAARSDDLRIGTAGDASEREADHLAGEIVVGAPVQVRARGAVQTLRRQDHGAESERPPTTTEAIERESGADAAIGRTLHPVPGMDGATFTADGCFRVETCGVHFRFQHAYIGTWTSPDGEDHRGMYVMIAMNYDPDCADCASLEAVQIVSDVTKDAHGDTVSAEPPAGPRRERSGWDDPAAPSRGWRVDAVERSSPGYDATDPFYTHSRSGRAGTGAHAAAIWDLPSSRIDDRNTGKQFHTCMVCVDASGARSVLGCVSWGYYVDASGVVSARPRVPVATCGETREMRDSVNRWDSLARRSGAQETHLRGHVPPESGSE